MIAGPETETLSVDEFRDVIRTMQEGDRLRLLKAARHWARAADDDSEGLLQEAIGRALEGTRQCPRQTSPVTFLSNVMRSLVSAEREAAKLRSEAFSLSATGTDGRAFDIPTTARDAEANLIARQDYEHRLRVLDELFEDDEEAQMIIMGDRDGLDAGDIRELAGLDHKAYASARRRIRRRIEAQFPRGFGA